MLFSHSGLNDHRTVESKLYIYLYLGFILAFLRCLWSLSINPLTSNSCILSLLWKIHRLSWKLFYICFCWSYQRDCNCTLVFPHLGQTFGIYFGDLRFSRTNFKFLLTTMFGDLIQMLFHDVCCLQMYISLCH